MASYHPGRAPKIIDEALRPVLEPLESRTLLSASLDNGTLNIIGSDAADAIQVRPAKDHSLLKVGVNGEWSVFKLADVTAINIDGGGGDDAISISEIGATIESPATVLGGAGNDSIQGGGGNDLLVGGDGNDSIVGGRGDDNIDAGDGKDTVDSNAGKDSINGGDGDDLIITSGNNPAVTTSAGNDQVSEGVKLNFPIQTFTGIPAGYSVQQMRQAYGFGDLRDKGYTNRGKGQNIVIVIANHSPRARQDLMQFAREQQTLPGVKNLKKWFQTHFHQVWIGPKGFRPFDQNATAEAMLDIQWAHAIAPEAKITLVEGENLFGANIEAAISKGIDILNKTKNHGGVISMSFAFNFPAPEQVAFETLFTSDRAKNVSFVVSSGDTGGVTSGTPVGPPTVTVVGGTKLYLDPWGDRITGYVLDPPDDAVNGGLTPVPPPIDNWEHDLDCFPPGDINDDTGQTGISGGEGAWWEGGGGPSEIFNAPFWQQNRLGGILVDTDGDGIPNRGTPDVAYNAHPGTGVPVFNSSGFNGQSGWSTAGGTSAGAPQFAALVALANQLRATDHKRPIGNSLNERIYRLGGTGPDQYFNDIDVHGSGLTGLGNPCDSPGTGRDPLAFVFPATPGWDYATGWGSPNARSLIPALAERKLKFERARTVNFDGRISQRVFTTVNGQPIGSTLDVALFRGKTTISGYHTLTMPSFRMHHLATTGQGGFGGGGGGTTGGVTTTVTVDIDVFGMDEQDGQPNVPAYDPVRKDLQSGQELLLAPGSPILLSRNGNSIVGHGFYLITVSTATTGGPGGGTQNSTYFYFPLTFQGKMVNGKVTGEFFTEDVNGQRMRGAFNQQGFPVVSGRFES